MSLLRETLPCTWLTVGPAVGLSPRGPQQAPGESESFLSVGRCACLLSACESRNLVCLVHLCVSRVYHSSWEMIGTQTDGRMNVYIVHVPVVWGLLVLCGYFVGDHVFELSR